MRAAPFGNVPIDEGNSGVEARREAQAGRAPGSVDRDGIGSHRRHAADRPRPSWKFGTKIPI
jgi:hypothetical protein